MIMTELIEEPYVEQQLRVEQQVLDIMAADRAQDIERLESYHLFGPKYSKFDDLEPLERQDAETSRRLKREAVTGVKEFNPSVSDLKVDVFGQVALATFVMDYRVVTAEDEQLSFRARSTMAFVEDRTEWKLFHEHFSPFVANS